MMSKPPESFWMLGSASLAKNKAKWAHKQTSYWGYKRTIININEAEALVIVRALEDYIKKHGEEYQHG